MARDVQLFQLTTGRCFSATQTVAAETFEMPAQPDRTLPATQGRSVMSAASVFKIIEMMPDSVRAVSADGQEATFSSDTKVTEVPRQGFNRLEQRAAEGP